MADVRIQNRRILVVEDDYFLASELVEFLNESGAIVVGPASSLQDALAWIEKTPFLEGAMLDVNLRGDAVFPVADELIARGIAFIFSTGYSGHDIPARYAHVPRIEKPFDPDAFASAFCQALNRARS